MAVEKRKIGQTNISITPLIFGGNVFGWTVDEERSFNLLDQFLAAGGNCIDTADVYSIWVPGHQGGESERIIGNWLKSRGARDRVVIATKVGAPISDHQRGLCATYITRAVESSLRRLQTDYIDIYQSHIDDVETPLEETLATYAKLIQQGKVLSIGASNITGDRLRQALNISKSNGWPRYECVQPLYNLYDREEFEKDLAPVCVNEGVSAITYFSLASGFLSGKYRSEDDLGKSPRGERVKKYMNERGMNILHALDVVAADVKATPAQVALAWLMQRPGVTAPIASATNVDQLKQMMGALNLTLDAKAMETLTTASAVF